jgi:hypothetical protein
MTMPMKSLKQQNGSKIKYYLEPFCPLRKGILVLVRERDVQSNTFYNGYMTLCQIFRFKNYDATLGSDLTK